MSSPVKQQSANKTSNIISDVFDPCQSVEKSGVEEDDDFNPRASDSPAKKTTGGIADFGDFASAFQAETAPSAGKKGDDDEFADFTSAFNAKVNVVDLPAQQTLLFDAPLPTGATETQQKRNLVFDSQTLINNNSAEKFGKYTFFLH